MAEQQPPRMETERSGLGGERQGAAHELEIGRARLEARRRILAGGLASVPVILTLTSRPAFAGGKTKGPEGQCGPSGMISGNLSQNAEPSEGCLGKTPGYWKTHVDKCSQYITAGPCNPIDSAGFGSCDDYSVPTKAELEQYLTNLKNKPFQNRTKIKQVEEYLEMLSWYPQCPPFGTPFADIFGSGLTQDANTTMMQALWLDDTPPLPPAGSGGPSPVLAHSAAAYLNACEFGKDRYGLTPQELVELVVSMILTDPFKLKDILETLNSRS